ncbi:MAG TPA: hypothetical protein V6C57_01420 [Coleofasciculaceae cyanobacterium]
MEQVLTIVCKLQPTQEQASKIDALLRAFADACNYAHQEVKPQISSSVTIQSLVYQTLRQQFGLSANQAVRACARVAADRKSAKQKGQSVKNFAPTSADYDARIFSLREKDWTVSLTLLGSRERIKFSASTYQRGKLTGKVLTSAQLCKHKDGQYYVHIQIKDEPPTPLQSDTVIGVDFGRRDIAVTSAGGTWDGKQIQEVRDRSARVKASLPEKASSKETASLTKVQRLSGREQRY